MAIRALRTLIPVEVLAAIAIAFAPLPLGMSIALPLLIVASLSRWLRGRSWHEVVGSPRGLLVGGIAGAIALVLAAPLFGAFHVTAVEWWLVPAARGESMQVVLAIAHAIVTAAALELALRGWILERVWELSPGPAALPIAVAAGAEALLHDGPIAARIGAALFGAGLGLLYVGCKRSVLAPIAARAVFAGGAILVELIRSRP